MRSRYSRRRFIRTSVGAGAALWLGCDDDADGTDGGAGSMDAGSMDAGGLDAGSMGAGGMDAGATVRDAGGDLADVTAPDAGPDCPDLFAGGMLEGRVDFDEPETLFHVRERAGWDGRFVHDLSQVPEQPITPNEEFFIRTFNPDGIDLNSPWPFRIDGLVAEPRDVLLYEFEPITRRMGVFLVECSGNSDGRRFGLMSSCEWSGVPMSEVLSWVEVQPGAVGVVVEGFDEHSVPSTHSTPGASWFFTFEQLEQTGAFIGTLMNNDLLPPDHGFPIRLCVPGWYGCTWIKWVQGVRVVGPDEPATAQMQEFASRTMQTGVPARAVDYDPASMDLAAMPVRVERWVVDGAPVHRVVGILWGGQGAVERLSLGVSRDGGDFVFEAVDVCPARADGTTWTVWSTAWRPDGTGRYTFRCAIDDPGIRTRRLDRGDYDRAVVLAG